ncbi:hypothetical protein BH23ACT9_BH23ACT9_34210 [soil metagenome]
MSAQQLADRVTEWTGLELTRDAIANLENGRRGRVSVDEVYALAYALGCAPVHLLIPPDARERVLPFPSAAQREGYGAHYVRAWVRGDEALPEVEPEPARRDRSARMHEHDLPGEAMRHKAAEHPGVKAIDRLRSTVVAHLVDDAGPDRRRTRYELQRALKAATRYVELLIDELEDEA